jgi:hypothetical protein
MYEKLYRHRDQFVVIDDVDSLYPDKSGMTLLCTNFPSGTDIAKRIRRNSDSVCIVAGGPFADACPQDALATGVFDVIAQWRRRTSARKESRLPWANDVVMVSLLREMPATAKRVVQYHHLQSVTSPAEFGLEAQPAPSSNLK